MKAADISDEAIVEAVRRGIEDNRRLMGHTFPWAFTYDIYQQFPDVPRKVVRAKLRRGIKKGIIKGCPCGCRGDFELGDVLG